MVLQKGMWKYNDSCRLMPPILRLPSQSLVGLRAKGFDEAVRGRIRRVARTVDVETADDLRIKNEVASDRVHVPTTLFIVCIIGPAGANRVDVDQTQGLA
jgi:hypothetical protein